MLKSARKIRHLVGVATVLLLIAGISIAEPAIAGSVKYLSFDGRAIQYHRGDWNIHFQGDLRILHTPKGYDPDSYRNWHEGFYLVDSKNNKVAFECDESQFDLQNIQTVYADFHCPILSNDWQDSSKASGTYNLVYKASISFGNDLFPIVVHSHMSFPKIKSTKKSLKISRDSVIAGSSITITPVLRNTWSDNVTTLNCTDGAKIQYRPVGTFHWQSARQFSDLGQTSGCRQRYRGIVTEPADFRLLFGNAISESKYVEVTKPTHVRKITNTTISKNSVIIGSVVTFSAKMVALYDDGMWHVAPKHSPYSLQFCPSGRSTWMTMATASVSVSGHLKIRSHIYSRGKWRFAASSAKSPTMVVHLVVP